MTLHREITNGLRFPTQAYIFYCIIVVFLSSLWFSSIGIFLFHLNVYLSALMDALPYQTLLSHPVSFSHIEASVLVIFSHILSRVSQGKDTRTIMNSEQLESEGYLAPSLLLSFRLCCLVAVKSLCHYFLFSLLTVPHWHPPPLFLSTKVSLSHSCRSFQKARKRSLLIKPWKTVPSHI